jgi:hypothetical protein
VSVAYKSGCADCDWWTESSEPDFGNCPGCGQSKTVWNMTDAENPTDSELQLEREIDYNRSQFGRVGQ